MPAFTSTTSPTPRAYFDSDTTFQSDADAMVSFVKRSLGDDVLSVELTNKQIWCEFEEAVCTYSRYINESKITSNLVSMLGTSTGSSFTGKYPRQTLEFLFRQAEPYSSVVGVGGSHDSTLGYINLVAGQQDYNLYADLLNSSGSASVASQMPTGSHGAMKILEVFHYEPSAAQHSLLNASNVTNFMATNFNYESYVNSTVFYVLPVFEDVLRRGALEHAFRVRRSNYSYQIIGRNLRIFPIPSTEQQLGKLYIRVMLPHHPLSASFQDDSMDGVSGPENAPVGLLMYNTITQPGKQWIFQYTLAMCKEVLGLTRSKYSTIPVPNAEVKLNGDELLAQSKEERQRLITELKEFLDGLTNLKLMEQQAAQAEALNKQLKFTAMPNAIFIG